MSDHPPSPLLAQYQRRTLSPAEFLEVHRHVLSCSDCHEKSNSPRQLKEDYENLRAALLPQPEEPPYHLSPDEVRRYVARQLDGVDLELVESHLEFCDTCAEASARQEEEAGGDAGGLDLRVGKAWQVLSSDSAASQRMGWGRMAALAAFVCVVLGAALLLGLRIFQRPEVAVTPSPGVVDAERGAVGANSSPNAGEPEGAPAPKTENENAAPDENGAKPEITPARALLVLNDGGRRFALDEGGNLSGAERLPPGLRQSIERMLSTGRVPRLAEAAELKGSRGTLLGEGENGPSFQLLSPVGKLVLSNRPSFAWQPLAGASSYTVTVVDARLNEVMTSGPLKTTNWTAAKPLENGGTYSWQVTAVKDGKEIVSPVMPSPPSRFKILERRRARQLEQARREFADSHLALAALYAEAGLSDEAESELRALLRANPRSKVVINLLRDLRR